MNSVIYNHLDLIGNTPLVSIGIDNGEKNIWAKLEYNNPTKSLKDRIAKFMIEDAEKSGLIHPGMTLIEPTSGNTGISLAFVCRLKGYNMVLTMPENMSIERRKMALLYGAKIVLTKAEDGFKGAIDKAFALQSETKNSHVLNQYDNLSNMEAHRQTTGKEIWEQTEGAVDVLIAGVGTGGMISGVSSFIKQRKPSFRAIAIEPTENNILEGGTMYSPHQLQGIGPNFIPKNFVRDVIDEIFHVSWENAVAGNKMLAKAGIAGGISSGANMYCASVISQYPEYKNKNIVIIVGSYAERYVSSKLFDSYI